MFLLIKLAWRNLWRNKRRTILTLLAISFATLITIAMRGMQLGVYEYNITNIVDMFPAYLQIQHKEYLDNPSINKSFKWTTELEEKLNSIPEIISHSQRVYANGLICFNDKSYGAAIFGVNPKQENKVSTILTKINKGKIFESDTLNEIVVGYKLLENLKANIGDEVVILSQGFDGSLGNMKFKIVGSIKTGSKEFDGMTIFMGLKTSQELLALYGGKIHSVAIKLSSIDEINDIKNNLNEIFYDKDIAVLSWEQIMPEFKQAIELDNVSGILMLGILILVVAFGILNTVLMSVTERFKEFGIALAVGIPNKKLTYIVFFETVFILLIGLIIGNIIGWAINHYIINNPITFTGEFAAMYEEYGFLPILTSTNKLSIFVNTSLTVLIVSFVVFLYPAYKLFKLEPLKGIRYT